MNKEKLDKIIVLVFGILLLGNALIGFYVIKHKEAFYSNPLAYGIKKYEGNLQCTCYPSEQGTIGGKIFKFNSTYMGYESYGILD